MPIERVAPELDRIVSADQNMEELGRGYSLSEGPLWWKEGGYLLFSEVNRDRLMKWGPERRRLGVPGPSRQRKRPYPGPPG